jgi:hypothetical protein
MSRHQARAEAHRWQPVLQLSDLAGRARASPDLRVHDLLVRRRRRRRRPLLPPDVQTRGRYRVMESLPLEVCCAPADFLIMPNFHPGAHILAQSTVEIVICLLRNRRNTHVGSPRPRSYAVHPHGRRIRGAVACTRRGASKRARALTTRRIARAHACQPKILTIIHAHWTHRLCR